MFTVLTNKYFSTDTFGYTIIFLYDNKFIWKEEPATANKI